jgi:primosomal protein N' (replication factor Y) (superfamily II helicase)
MPAMRPGRVDRVTPSLIEMPEVRTAPVATVALLQLVDKLYSYRVPEELQTVIAPGMRITVPFSRTDRPVEAFCVDVSERPWDSTLKAVIAPIDERPLLSAKMLELGRWIARYYAAPLGRTLDLMVPAAAKRHAGWKKVHRAVLVPGKDGAELKLSAKQTAVLSALRNAGGPLLIAECAAAAQCGESVIQSLARKGLIVVETNLEAVLPKEAGVERHEPTYALNADQRTAVEQMSAAVSARRFSVQVLFGVTGSGKTECYVATIRQALAAGRQAIMLVPEIALTTQTVRRLQARFERVATVHSGMSEVERSRSWAAIASGQIPVVIGTRSAVFAPCPNLGVIVVDEEAEASYKNQASPRYHTRDVAVKRAQLEEIPVVLGSATPSLETWKNVRQKKHYNLIRLPRRVRGLAMPTMHLVDMRDEHKERSGVHLLSREMEERLAETLVRGEQAVLLLNRRGYANFLHCPRCKVVVTCPHCSVHMVFHSTTELAHCHYCHARLAVPTKCQSAGCGGPLVKFGIGVQRVEEELRERYPQARLRRVDSDMMQRSGDYAEVLGAFERKEFDILVGTQMIAKGLDFPFVSFVGVVSADTALALDDFRSEERTFQLVLQVAGRSGRGDVGGHVVVQTFAADTAPIQHAAAGNYEGFADAELAQRKRAKLPPHTRMMRIILSDARMSRLEKAAVDLAGRIRGTLERRGIAVTVMGPFPAPIARLRDKYRYDIQLIFITATAMLAAIDLFKSEHTLQAKVKTLIADVDPVSLQ